MIDQERLDLLLADLDRLLTDLFRTLIHRLDLLETRFDALEARPFVKWYPQQTNQWEGAPTKPALPPDTEGESFDAS